MIHYDIQNNEIHLKKILNLLDNFAIRTCRIINKFFDYVIVGGYVAILFGRSRTTEDIDVIIRKGNLDIELMEEFYSYLQSKNYWVFNALTPKTGYKMLKNGINIRIAEKEKIIPNIELKLARKNIDYESFNKSIKVILEKGSLLVGNLELNIAFKFYLSSMKDIEDAVYLYCLFNEYIDIEKIYTYASKLNIKKKSIEKYLRC